MSIVSAFPEIVLPDLPEVDKYCPRHDTGTKEVNLGLGN